MISVPRPVGLALLLLLLFLGAAVTLQVWLLRETRQVKTLAIEEQRTRLDRIVAVSSLPPERWDASFQKELGAMLGGTIQVYRTSAPLPPISTTTQSLSFTQAVGGTPGWEARVTFAPPALLRVQILHERMLVTIVLLALLLALVPLLVVVLSNRRGGAGLDTGTRSPWAGAQRHAAGFEQLARLSNERNVALAAEHAARSRAEQDLEVNRTLLDSSVAERVRLGRELHDNICQTLYAVCLTLESVVKKSALAPEMKERTDQCLAELRRVNKEVRTYLQELEPGSVNGQSFATALAGLIGSLPTDDGVQIERRLDAATIELIPHQQVAEIMNILREAVSNSLRHGGARNIVLRAARDDQSIALSVQDDGAGFVPRPGKGHGLPNMQARATALGGHLTIESTPGKGTRVLLVLPVPTYA